MEWVFQYVGERGSDVEHLYVYSSPNEAKMDRYATLPLGCYLVCSEMLYYENQCWMKIRRGYFSNTKQNGYIRVEIDHNEIDPVAHCSALASTQIARIRGFHRLPSFPTFLCASERLVLSRIPVFNLHQSKCQDNESARSSPTISHARFVPPASVFQATECRFNEEFTQLALKITTAQGVTGWINVSFHDTLLEVDDPRPVIPPGCYVQNIAPTSSRWRGELPVRGMPNLQAPKVGYLPRFTIVRALERKLVKDHVWLRVEYGHQGQVEMYGEEADPESDQTSNENLTKEGVWIIERRANTGERVVAPFGCGSFEGILKTHAVDNARRFYRNVYSKRPLPVRKTPHLSSEVVGMLDPGTIVCSTNRVLNEEGRMWVHVHSEGKENPQDGAAGYIIQCNAKSNRTMLQELHTPKKLREPAIFQVQLPKNTEDVNGWPVYTDSSSSSMELFQLKHGALVRVLGSTYNSRERRIWYQVDRSSLDQPMIIQEGRRSSISQCVVHLPACHPYSNPTYVGLRATNLTMSKIDRPSNARTAPSRVVFSKRASKLFGNSQLLSLSTMDLDHSSNEPVTSKCEPNSPVAAAAGEDEPPRSALSNQHKNICTKFSSSTLSLYQTWLAPLLSCRHHSPHQYTQVRCDDDEEVEV